MPAIENLQSSEDIDICIKNKEKYGLFWSEEKIK